MLKKVHLKNLFLIFLSFAFIIFPIIIISANLNETQQIIARDSKRISDISTLYSKIEKYKTEYGYYPKIDSSDSSYKINGFVSSTMQEGWNKFSSSLGISNIVDPINKNVRNIKIIASPYELDIDSTTCSLSAGETGIYIDGVKKYSYSRGYIVSNFDSNWNYKETVAFDTYIDVQNAIDMRDHITTISQDDYIIIYTYDEPRENMDVIWNTLLNLGASNEMLDKIGNNPDCGYRSVYILIGKRNLYEGGAFYEKWGPRGESPCMGCPISYEFSVDSLNKSLYGDYGYTWTKGSSAYHYIYCPKDTYPEGDNCNIVGATIEDDSFYLELDLEDVSRLEDWGLQNNPHIFYSKDGIDRKIYSNNDSVCGNYVLEGREECELGSSPRMEACMSGLESGYKVFPCDFSTCLYEIEDSENPKECILEEAYCGDGIIQDGEECEGGYEELCGDEHNWYNEIIRYCTSSCKWNIDDDVANNITEFDCGGYCGDLTVQEEYGEDCDDETTNCVDCKYVNKSPTIEGVITSSIREDYIGDNIERSTYETPGIFKDSKYFILKADASDILSGNTYYKWKITRASNYELDIREHVTELSVITSSIMKNDESFETEYTQGLDTIRIYPTGSDLNPGGDEIFDHNYTGVYNIVLFMKNQYTETESGEKMYSTEVSHLYDFAIGSVCGDHIVQTPNSQGKDEYCEWKKGFYRNTSIENGTPVYNTQIYGGGNGVDGSDQYYCTSECNDAGGYCGDYLLQVEFEKCDPSSVSSTFNVFGTGLNNDESYGCDTSCQVSNNYCGDGNISPNFEVCDPTYPVPAGGSSTTLQYLCENGTPNNNNVTPWVVDKKAEEDGGISGIEYIKNTLPSATCTYTTGGYCGDGIVQHYYITTTEDDKTIYTGTYNTNNSEYAGKADLDPEDEHLRIEDCDPKNFEIPSNLSDSNPDYTYSCTADCKLKAQLIHENSDLVGGFCGDGYIQTNHSIKNEEDDVYTITSIDQSDYGTKPSSERSSYNLEKCDYNGFRNPNKNAHKDALNQYSCTESCTFSGGYCGDGDIQYQWKEVDDIIQISSESQTSYNGKNSISSGWNQLEICDPDNYHKPTPAESSSNWQYQCTGNCEFTGGYCGDGTLQEDHGELCEGNYCINNCSECEAGYYNSEGICTAPSSGYCSSLDGTSCSGDNVPGSITQIECPSEMYDTRTDLTQPNPTCGGECDDVYGDWIPSICNSNNMWNATRDVPFNLISYCTNTNTITYGSCYYCNNPGGTCYSYTAGYCDGKCCDTKEYWDNCPSGWISYGTYDGWCGICKEGCNNCENALYCQYNNACYCEDLDKCPCYGRSCAN